eukprot:8107519-Lingulodinium_polyedra.AAC.1
MAPLVVRRRSNSKTYNCVVRWEFGVAGIVGKACVGKSCPLPGPLPPVGARALFCIAPVRIVAGVLDHASSVNSVGGR